MQRDGEIVIYIIIYQDVEWSWGCTCVFFGVFSLGPELLRTVSPSWENPPCCKNHQTKQHTHTIVYYQINNKKLVPFFFYWTFTVVLICAFFFATPIPNLYLLW